MFDMNGGTTILDPDGHYEKTLLLPFSRVDGALPLDDQAVLLRGAAYHETEIRLLHVMDLAEERVEVSFFPLPPGIPHELAISMAYAAVDVRGDTVITAFGGLDSVFVYTLDGQRQRAFEIPVDNFRVVGARPATSDPRQVQAYHGSYETMGGIWWLAPDLIAVSYKTQIPGGMDWHWAVMTNTGELVHQERSSVMLLGADPARSVLLAVSPGSEVPNTWCEINVARGR